MTHDDDALPPLIAHRGNAGDFPENTVESLRSAIELGLRHVEFDVHLTADGVPVVIHDSDLLRVSGRPECVHDLMAQALLQIPVDEAARFGGQFGDVRVPTLARVVELLARTPQVTAFVEVKRASIRRFGREQVLKSIATVVEPILAQCVFISFDLASVRLLRAMTGGRIGWVIGRYDENTRAELVETVPEFVFVNLERVPAEVGELWPGPWAWAVYEVRDTGTARHCAALGAEYVETMNVREMLDAYARAAHG